MSPMATDPRITDPGGSEGPSWPAIWLFAFAVATPLAWSSVAFVYFGMLAAGRPLTFGHSLLAGLADWYVWAAFTPVVFSLGQRFRLERHRWVAAGLFHLVFGTMVALGDLALVTAINRHFGPTVSYVGPVFWDVYLKIVLRYFHFAFIIYWVIVAAAHAAQYYRSSRDRELEASQLQSELTLAQLAALRMQLQPHFLFNTLHTIASLVRDGRGEAATSTIARLGELLRQTLGSLQRNEVPLREELSFIEAYLEIEQTRFSDRLTVRFDVDRDTLEAPVPNMSLQPLVENAIRHGIARDPSAGRIEIRARQHDGRLRIEVRNDGPAYAGNGGGAAVGVGLANTRARLSRLYGAGYRLDLVPDDAGGTLAVLEVPWQVDEEDAG
jgi:two-component system, LytTR family, sensor kinase